MKFRVKQLCSMVGNLKTGYRIGIVEAETKEEALAKIKNEEVYMEFFPEDFNLIDYEESTEPKIEEVEESLNLSFTLEEMARIAESGDNIDEGTEKYIEDLRRVAKVYKGIVEKLDDAMEERYR